MTKMTRKWLAEWGFANSRGGLAASVVTQFCRSVGMPSIALDKARAAMCAGGTADMCHRTDVVGAGYLLRLRF